MSTARLCDHGHATIAQAERFAAKVMIGAGDACWLWLGAKDKKGYGKVRFLDGMLFAHRVSYYLFVGIIPEGQSILHRCDTPACVRPDHLFLGTQRDNMVDKSAKGRVLRGSKHQNSRITEAQAASILLLAAKGSPQSLIAKLHGISQSQVSNIVRRKVWRHI